MGLRLADIKPLVATQKVDPTSAQFILVLLNKLGYIKDLTALELAAKVGAGTPVLLGDLIPDSVEFKEDTSLICCPVCKQLFEV